MTLQEHCYPVCWFSLDGTVRPVLFSHIERRDTIAPDTLSSGPFEEELIQTEYFFCF